MLKGASRAVLKIVEEELHEAWRSGYVEGKSEVAHSAVPAILSARFGPEAGAFGATVKLVSPDRFAELIVVAATCPDLVALREQLLSRKRKRRS
jgi:hypothetical protein